MADVDQSAAETAKTHAGAGDSHRESSASANDALGLSRGDVRFALVCGASILLLMLVHWVQHAWWGAQLVEIDRLPSKVYEFRLDINSATWVEWTQLAGIGEVLARRIVSDREEFGPFAGIEDLQRVPGIGAKTLEILRPHLICTDCARSGAARDQNQSQGTTEKAAL